MSMGKMLIAGVVVLAGTAASAFAGTVNVSATGSTGVAPATVGGFAMTAFPDDGRANFTLVTDVAAPGGGVVGFGNQVSLREIGAGWATWSHGYTGDVYFSNAFSSVTLTLPASTVAFYLYAEPERFADLNIAVSGTDGGAPVQTSTFVDGQNGAERFEFWMTGGGTLTSITVSMGGGELFAIGEFGISRDQSPTAPSVPLPSSALSGLAVLGVLGVIGLRRRNRVSIS